MRALQAEKIARFLGERLPSDIGLSAEGISLIMAGLGRVLVMEGSLGVTAGHEEVRAWVEARLGNMTAQRGVPAPA
jgi:hypothetical protein